MDFIPLYKPTRNALHRSKGKWRKVAQESGVSYETIKKVSDGRIRNPGILTIERLAKFLSSQKGQRLIRDAESARA